MAKKQSYNKARYERNKENPEYMERVHAYNRALYARQKLNPEWVAAQAEKLRKKRQNLEWAARRAETKRKYDESVQNDPVKRRRRNEFVNQWRQNHKELCATMNKHKSESQKINNPIKVILSRKKRQARRLGVDFNLEPADLVIPETCPVLHIPIAFFLGRLKDNTASIDRIDPQKGYVKGNIQVVSMLVNRLKSNCTDPAVFRAIADYIEANLKA